ncbi:LexA repressor [Sodalis praecaptivus]|uniref:S24 family peptidase n=1 Tax=Sodalis praecaptivus TaxID=1239307 RepID=UPI0027E7C1C4|nr:S24 family peptidase [Sodalis praecaptivus]CAJ0999081.1 LexA repressor [Sodalis praecaptivus]
MNLGTEKLNRNIKSLMAKKQVKSVAELSRRIGMPQPTLHRMLNGEVKSPRLAVVQNIAKFFNVKANDLLYKDLTLEDNHQPEEIPQTETFPDKPIHLTFIKIPVLGTAQLGGGGYWDPQEYAVGQGDGYVLWPTKDKDAFALKCQGDSMMPRIQHGEFVVIEPNRQYKPGDEVLVQDEQGEVMVKVFLFQKDGLVSLLSVNSEHAPIRLDANSIKKMFYVAGIVKDSLYYPD